MSESETQLVTEFTSLLENWNSDRSSWIGDNLIQKLTRLAEITEIETEAYYKLDLDPFDDRHPDRADPNSGLGKCLKLLSKNDQFLNELVSQYLMRSREDIQRQTVSCRLLLDVMPGVEASILYQETEGLTTKLFDWAEKSLEPLRTYATGLLAVAIKLPEIATDFREKNARLVPIMLERLHSLKESQHRAKNKRNFSEIDLENSTSAVDKKDCSTDHKSVSEKFSLSSFESSSNLNIHVSPYKSSGEDSPNTSSPNRSSIKRRLSPRSDEFLGTKRKRYDSSGTSGNHFPEYSNSSWSDMEHYVIGSYPMSPLNVTMKQRIILQYLIPMGEYQELMGHAFEYNAMNLIFFYIDLKENSDVRLAFEALKYLATLLCHKKFAIEFLQNHGIEKLIEVNRPSIAASGVSLCLYFMSYFEDALERVCLRPEHILRNLVEYALWLLECSHDSSRIHAAMFLSQTFPFKVLLDLFDQQNGLRRLLNAISTLQLLNIEANFENTSEDYIYTMRQTSRHVCGAMKRYFESHMVMKAEEIKRSHERNDENASVTEIAAFKAVKISEESFEENVEILSLYFPIRSHWTPVVTFQKLSGIHLLLQLAAMAPEWNSYPGKPETVKAALDVLAVCTVTPKAQSVLLESIPLPNENSSPGISIVISMAEGETLLAPEVQRSALIILSNCVCGPMERFTGGVGRFMGSGSKKKLNSKAGEDMLSKMWTAVRSNNGVMALLKLLSVKTPITDADAIRALACKTLVGLARSETLRQIISKLPMFNNGQLQMLMKEPILQDKRPEHIKFCKYASELLEKVSGKQSKCISASLEEIRRSDIVSQTKIIFQEKELLQLICGHLVSKGYSESANVLCKEAKLPALYPSPVLHIATPSLFSPTTPRLPIARQHSASSSVSAPSLSGQPSPSNSSQSLCATPSHIKFTLGRHLQTNELNTPKTPLVQPKVKTLVREKENLPTTSTSPYVRMSGKSFNDYDMSLDKIVTEYLRKQHALCPNPVVTCPPMSLFSPHQCPEPRGRTTAPANFTMRLLNRPIFPTHGGLRGSKLDRKFIYSRFRPVKTYKDNDDDGFACCALTPCERYLLLGTFSGEIKMSNIYTEEMGIYNCHSSPVIHLDPARDGKLLLTSTWGTMQDSSLWTWTEDTLENKFTFDDTYAEFSKLTQDKIIGTKDETAHVYDTATGQIIDTLYDPNKANNYKSNIATFSPLDDLILNDGVLWDIRVSKAIHKFDKFNPSISGVFHPSGLEIIINSEVWDARTFHLLNTVPSLDQCQIQFNYSGDVIYATHFDEDPNPEEERHRSPYSSTLRTFDSSDYTSIGTKDLKTKSIFDLSTDKSDCLLAVVENQKFSETSGEESICRLYEVGKRRDDEEDQMEDEEDKVNDDEDDDDDDDDDDEVDFNIGSDDGLGDLEYDVDDDDDDAEFVNGEDDDEDDEDDDGDDDIDFNLNNASSDADDDDALFQII